MPLAVRAGTSPPPPGPPVTVATDTIHAVWIGPDGTTLDLTSPGGYNWFTTRGIGGWGAVPVSRQDDPTPRGGVVTRHVRDEPRSITWPLYAGGGSLVEVRDNVRRIVRTLKATSRMGPGLLRVTFPDGQAREIECLYEDGLGGDVGQGWQSASPVLTLFCPDGFWRDTTPQVVTRSYATGVPYLEPYPTVSSGQVLGATQIVNPGETDAWPDWLITGPAEEVVATNHTTGEAFTLTYSLSAGETITITTDPPTVRGPAGEVLTSALNWPGAVLWPLTPGTNDVEFAVSGSTTGTTIQLSYIPRYEMW